MIKHLVRIALITLFVTPTISSAGFRCETGKLVDEGDTKSEIKLICGQPMDASYEGVIKHRGKFVYVDRWIYGADIGQFYRILEFHDGVLVNIETGPRVQ